MKKLLFLLLLALSAGPASQVKETPMALLLVVLFLGSAAFAEDISGGKYPEYKRYCQKVNKFFPGRKYQE